MNKLIPLLYQEIETFKARSKKEPTHVILSPDMRDEIAREIHRTAIDVRVVCGLQVILEMDCYGVVELHAD